MGYAKQKQPELIVGTPQQPLLILVTPHMAPQISSTHDPQSSNNQCFSTLLTIHSTRAALYTQYTVQTIYTTHSTDYTQPSNTPCFSVSPKPSSFTQFTMNVIYLLPLYSCTNIASGQIKMIVISVPC